MLQKVGRVTVVYVYPAGTGKFFIGFKLCEDHLERAVCGLFV